MQDDDPNKTTVMRRPEEPRKSLPPAQNIGPDGFDPNQTMMVQPSQRARAAATALENSRRERTAAVDQRELQYSGTVDFDITTEIRTQRPPRLWPRVLLWMAGLGAMGALIWWILS